MMSLVRIKSRVVSMLEASHGMWSLPCLWLCSSWIWTTGCWRREAEDHTPALLQKPRQWRKQLVHAPGAREPMHTSGLTGLCAKWYQRLQRHQHPASIVYLPLPQNTSRIGTAADQRTPEDTKAWIFRLSKTWCIKSCLSGDLTLHTSVMLSLADKETTRKCCPKPRHWKVRNSYPPSTKSMEDKGPNLPLLSLGRRMNQSFILVSTFYRCLWISKV